MSRTSKITALYERLSRKNTTKIMPIEMALRISAILLTMVFRV